MRKKLYKPWMHLTLKEFVLLSLASASCIDPSWTSRATRALFHHVQPVNCAEQPDSPESSFRIGCTFGGDRDYLCTFGAEAGVQANSKALFVNPTNFQSILPSGVA